MSVRSDRARRARHPADAEAGCQEHRTRREHEAHVKPGEGQLRTALLNGSLRRRVLDGRSGLALRRVVLDLRLNHALRLAVAVLDGVRALRPCYRSSNCEHRNGESSDGRLLESHKSWSPYHVVGVSLPDEPRTQNPSMGARPRNYPQGAAPKL